jgi:hypothetical protein
MDDEYEMMKADWGDPMESLDNGVYDSHPAYLALAKHECKGCEDSAWEVLEIEDDHEGGWIVIVKNPYLCVMTARLSWWKTSKKTPTNYRVVK